MTTECKFLWHLGYGFFQWIAELALALKFRIEKFGYGILR
jgi:hypothetical protein